MPTKDELLTAYPELLTAASDARERGLIADLHTIYSAAEPPAALQDAVRQAALAARGGVVPRPGPRTLRRPARPRRSHLASAAVLLLVALLAGGGYAVRAATVDPVPAMVQRAIAADLDPDVARLERAGLLRHEHISQSVDEYTVTLWRAYADASAVILVSTVTTPATGVRKSVDLAQPVLTDSRGDVLPGGVFGFRSAVEADTQVFINRYDASGLRDQSGTIGLQWRVGALQATQLSTEAAQPQRPWDRLQGLDHTLERLRPPTNTTAQAQLDTRPKQTIAGPFTFAVMLPFLPAHIATPDQTVTAQGIAITLQRVAVTPSEIRVIVRIHAVQGLPAKDWHPMIRLAVGNWNSRQPPRGGDGGAAAADGTYRYTFTNAPAQAAGQWTLTVDAIDDYVPQQASVQAHIVGPWVFHFTLP